MEAIHSEDLQAGGLMDRDMKNILVLTRKINELVNKVNDLEEQLDSMSRGMQSQDYLMGMMLESPSMNGGKYL